MGDRDPRVTWQVVIPSRPVSAARDAAAAHVRAWYREHVDADVAVGGDVAPDAPWSKGTVVDEIVGWTDAEGLIVADADVLVSPDALARSMLAVEAGAAWSQPHGMVYRLSRRATLQVYAGTAGEIRPMGGAALDRPAHYGPPGGGIVVLSRTAYREAGGLDPRFTDWGGEDISWARALDTLAGPCVRFDAPMWHLWHERMWRRPGNRASPENEAVAARYAVAAGDPDAMRALVREHA